MTDYLIYFMQEPFYAAAHLRIVIIGATKLGVSSVSL